MDGAEVIELGDATLLPGLIDAHKHMGGAPETDLNTFQERLTISKLEESIGSAANARKLLEEGFTTVRSVGAHGGADLALKRAIERGWAVGPRMLVSLEAVGADAVATAIRVTASTRRGATVTGAEASSTAPSTL